MNERLRARLWRAVIFILSGVATVPAGCSGFSSAPQAERAAQTQPALPIPKSSIPEILFMLAGSKNKSNPSIAAYNAHDKSPQPKPLYTIAPNGGGSYELMAVDRHGNLFVSQSYGSDGTVTMFPPGSSQAGPSCAVPGVYAMFVANGELFVSSPGYTNSISIFAEPFPKNGCGKPLDTLTDQLANKAHATGILGLAVDRKGDIFDVWHGTQYYHEINMDVFEAGKRVATHFSGLSDSYTTTFLVADRNDNIVTNISGNGSFNDFLGVFPDESRKPVRYYPLGYGDWQGLGFGKSDAELYALATDPVGSVDVFAYNTKTGVIGERKRSYKTPFINETSIAVWSK